jgi:hypothetical protein
MSNSKVGLGVTSFVALVAIGVAIYESNAARQAQSLLAVAAETHTADLAKQQQLVRAAAADDQKWSEVQKTIDTLRASAAPVTPVQTDRGAKAAADRKAALAAGQAFLAAFPQARQMLLDVGKAQIARNYAAFYRTAGLTPAQIETLENQTNAQWVQTAMVAGNGVHPGDPQLPDDQLKEILGDQGFQRFQEFKRVQQLQGLINDASSMSSAAPITGAQADQLTTIIANASSSYQGGGNANPGTVDWNQVLVQSQGVLTEPQLASIRYEAEMSGLGPLLNQFRAKNPPQP